MTARDWPVQRTARRGFWATAFSVMCLTTLCNVRPSLAHHDHWSIPDSMRKELKIRISVDPVAGPSRLLPMRIDVLWAGMGLESGFGVKVFVDKIKVHTDLTARETTHFFHLDLAQIGPGYHYIIANVCDHHDHIGVASVWVAVRPELDKVTQYEGTPPELIERWKQGRRGWPGQYTVAPAPADPAIEAPRLECCGRFADWPIGAQGVDIIDVSN